MGFKALSHHISKQRSKNYLNQLKGSFIFKILAVVSSFLIIPIMIDYLGNEQYGVWSTLLSIVSWVVLFDLGIGNGLRNKIAESLAKDNFLEAQKYISTSYVLIGIISIVLLIVFAFISNVIPWQKLFNTTVLNYELKSVVNITIGLLIVNFWLSLINQVANGLQKTSITVFNQFLSNFISLVLVYLLSKLTDSSLFDLALVYSISLLISNITISIWFYSKNKYLIPKLSLFNKKFIKSITSLGFQFFIVQIAVIVIFTTDKILITQLFGPEYVTQYDVVFKLFSAITILHGILMAPLWSAYTDAYHRNDFIWIKTILKKQLLIWMGLVLITVLFIILAPKIIDIWIGSTFEVDNLLIVVLGGFTLISTWNNIFAYFVNGIGKIKIQIYTSIFALIINIPLSIFIVKYFHTGTWGIVIGTILSLSLFAFFGARQTYIILQRHN